MRKSISRACLLLAALSLVPLTVGCGKKTNALDEAAPPPSNPDAKPEVSVNKRMPGPPPSMADRKSVV